MNLLPSMHRRAALLSPLALTLAPRGAMAQGNSLGVSPLFIELGAGRSTAVLEVTNRSTAPVAAQVRAFAWAQEGEADPLTPTADLLVSPGIARLAPSETQVVRLALRRPPGPQERAYRVLVDQIPEAATSQGRIQLQIALRLSLPVRVAGTAARPASLAWRAERDATGAVLVVARNEGQSFTRVGQVEVVQANGRRITGRPRGQTPYVLPGQERRWEIASLPARAGALRLVAATGLGRIEQPLTLVD